MRLAILSDIHGNQVALEAVLADLRRQPAIDQLIIAGDLCLNGPRPREVLAIVQQLGCPVIRGNVDEEVVSGAPEKGKKKRSAIAWTREQIGAAGLAYLRSLPFSYRVSNPAGSDALIVHANPLNLEEAIPPNASDAELERLLGTLDEEIGVLAFGHLHIAYTRRWRRLLLVDVASCGLPRDGDQRAAYGILSWQAPDSGWQAEIRRVPYDVERVIEQLRQSDLPNAEQCIAILRKASY